MASTSPEASQVPQEPVSLKKRMRLNPARRKAAAKAKADAGNEKAQSETTTASGTESTQLQLKKSTSKPNQSVATKTNPAAPTPLQRQNTEPVTTVPSNNVAKPSSAAVPSLPKQNPEPSSATPKPNLTRSITAPPSTTSPKSTLALTAPALVTGGLVGCAAGAAILLGVGIWYDFSGAEQAILTAKAARLCVDNLAEELISSLKTGTYSADEAVDMLRRTTLAYASTIPEGAPFVERVFREIDTVRKQRGREVDRVVAETYGQLQKAGRRGAGSAEMRTIVVGQLAKLTGFAGRATRDVVARNPSLRPYREGAAKALKGPEESNVPTVKVNMAVRQKQASGV